MRRYGLAWAQLAVVSLGCASVMASAATTGAKTTAKIPFVVGLSTVRAISTPDGDYETLMVINSIDAIGYRAVRSGELPGTDGGEPVQLTIPRNVLAADQINARKLRPYFCDGDAETFPGTVPGFSSAVVDDLRGTGTADIRYLDVGEFFGTCVVKDEYSGTLTRVADPSPSLTVLVNGRSASLPVLHAKGALTGRKGQAQFEYFVLDDPSNPIVLRWSGLGVSSAVLRIEYPQPKEAPSSIESALVKDEVAEVYGIYFSFNRADIRPESERVLKEIAAILVAHPNWKLRVDGHTDGVGNDAANLDLSKRRAAAVKAALVTVHSIDPARLTTGGYGASSPQAANDTPEGRARNRRVELRRE